MPETITVFISSKMLELASERAALFDFIPRIDCGGFQLQPWVFERTALPSSKSIRESYLDALNNSALYIGLFWNQYGEWTIDEFERAAEWQIERHIYVKDVERDLREPRLGEFLTTWGDVTHGITQKWFTTTDELLTTVDAALRDWIEKYVLHHQSSREAQLLTDPAQIPLQVKIIGRDAAQAKTLEQLRAGEQVLLQGMGGVGKTCLAQSVVARWLRDGHHALWLRTGSAGSRAIFEAILRGLQPDRLGDITRAQPEKQHQVIRELLQSHDAQLLVLDDAWNGQALFEVAHALPPGFPLLVTARQRYPMARIHSLLELDDADALELLEYYADAAFSDPRQQDAARDLCRLLGNHPFALEIAGKKLKSEMETPRPSVLIKAIRDAPHQMNVPENYNQRERGSLKDLLDSSYHALDPASQKVILACGVFFATQITSELLALYLGAPAELDSSLKRLVTSGLLRVDYVEDGGDGDIPVYRLHDLTFSYLRAQASAANRAKAVAACLAFARQYGDKPAFIDMEINNLLGSARHAYEKQDAATVIDLMRIVAAGGYMDERGHTLTLLARLDEAITLARAHGGARLEDLHYLVSKRGNAHYERGELEAARHCYQETADTAQALHLEERYIRAQCLAYDTASELGQIEAAEAGLRDLESRVTAQGDDALLACVYEAWAYHYERHDNYSQCRLYAMREAEIGRRLPDDASSLFFGLLNWGIAEKALDNAPRSRELLEEALQIGKDNEVATWEAGASHALAETLLVLGVKTEAQQHAARALALFQEIGFTARTSEVETLLQKIDA